MFSGDNKREQKPRWKRKNHFDRRYVRVVKVFSFFSQLSHNTFRWLFLWFDFLRKWKWSQFVYEEITFVRHLCFIFIFFFSPAFLLSNRNTEKHWKHWKHWKLLCRVYGCSVLHDLLAGTKKKENCSEKIMIWWASLLHCLRYLSTLLIFYGERIPADFVHIIYIEMLCRYYLVHTKHRCSSRGGG